MYTEVPLSRSPAVELLSEVVQSNALSEADIEQQRSVVLRELEEVEGSLQDVCLDLLHATAFQGTPLGHSVLGPSQNARYTHTQSLPGNPIGSEHARPNQNTRETRTCYRILLHFTAIPVS